MGGDDGQSAMSDRVVAWLVPKIVQGAAGLAITALSVGYFLLDGVLRHQGVADVERAALAERVSKISGRLDAFIGAGDRFTKEDGRRHDEVMGRNAANIQDNERRIDTLEAEIRVLDARVRAARGE